MVFFFFAFHGGSLAMTTLRFRGKLHPQYEIFVKDLPVLTADSQGLAYSVYLDIENGAVVADCVFDNPLNETTSRAAFDIVLQYCYLTVDILAFHRGQGISVNLETMTDEVGTTKKLFVYNSEITGLVTAFNIGDESLHRVLYAVGTDPNFHYAIRDLIDGITIRRGSEVNFARAIETLRVLISSSEDRKIQWELFQRTLRVTKDYLKLITDHSRASRHGDRHSEIPYDEKAELTKRVWIVMNRYIEFKLRGSQPLPEDEFPWL
jgi:hypothetical protein